MGGIMILRSDIVFARKHCVLVLMEPALLSLEFFSSGEV